MFSGALGLPHLLIILVILLLLFGAPKLPALAKSVAQSMKIFKTEIGPNHDGSSDAATTAPANAAPTTVAPTPAAPVQHTTVNPDGSTTTTVTTPAPSGNAAPLNTDKPKL